MVLRHCLPWVPVALACTLPSVRRPTLQAGDGPSVQVGAHDVLVVFPADPQTDFPWPAQRLTDAYAGPLWGVSLVRAGRPILVAAAGLGAVDSLGISAHASLDAVVRHVRIRDCTVDSHVLACGRVLDGTVTVNRSRLVMRIRDGSWFRTIRRQRPDSAWLRVDRPNRRPFWNGRVEIRFLTTPDQ